MTMNSRTAYILMGLGALILLTQMGGWIWIAFVALGLLWTYVQRRLYSLLIAGSVVMGLAVGGVLEFRWDWEGALLISLGVGFMVIDRVEQRKNRWPRLVGRILIALGVFIGLASANLIGSIWLALLLIIVGAVLLRSGSGPEAKTGSGPWVTVGPQTENRAKAAAPNAQVSPASETADLEATPADPEAVTLETAEDAKAPGDELSGEREPLSETETAAAYDEAFYSRLEAWRRDTAKAEDRAAYLILTNASLEQIAREKPQDLVALRAIKGIGPVKLERYGEAILRLTKPT